ncbi:MAG: type II toxin-antitoxin system RelE/ParE family toxin [Deltaproteobacteria bacterium]|nr:type II toxin-antitoxin system RelE/ParE family toxin [Deltaproteobacteria bacterium]
MKYKIAFKKSVSRDLKKIDKEQADRILKKIEDELPQKAEALPILTGKFSGLRKFRVGDFRVIFSIIGDTALILRIRHRKEAYRFNITPH